MLPLSDLDLERLSEGACTRVELSRSEFLDNLINKIMNRYPPLQEAREVDPEELQDPTAAVELAQLPGGVDDATEFAAGMLATAKESPYFDLVRKVAENGDSPAFEQLMKSLDSSLRLRGIFFRHGLDPEREVAGIWGRVWEAIPKWDGRDFRAYVARIVRNYCLDEIHRKKRNPAGIDDDPRDVRPSGQAAHQVSRSDALDFLQSVLDELEQTGRIKAIDAVIFSLICGGRQVADILSAFSGSPAVPRVTAAARELAGPKARRLSSDDAVALGYLLADLEPAEVASLTKHEASAVEAAAAALGRFQPESEDALLAGLLARTGMTFTDLSRAQRLNANAINLCINRIRLKVWMALVDRAYESLRRRKQVDELDLAIVQHRCTMPTHAGCRMYKDGTCKREAEPDQIARLAGLDATAGEIRERMGELRRRIVEEGLGMVFPDYNSCLNERKPGSKKT
jgi:hypothetical protein